MRLNIDFVTETYPPEVNGVAMTVGRLVDGLRGRGHAVRVLRPRQGARDGGGPDESLFPSLPLPGYPGLRFGLPAAGALTRRWQGERPDLVHVVTEGPLGWSAVHAAQRLGIPVTSGFHTNFDRYSAHYGMGWMRPAVAAYLRSLHRRARATLVPTEALAAELAGSIPGVRVVGRGVDTGLFDPARRSARLRAAWGATEGAPVCLYVGRLAPEKNLSLVERAFAAINARVPAARLVWVGDGPSRGALRSARTACHFAGQRTGDDLAAHYASADLFLFPSLTETYGNVVAEAMASGLAVVAYRCAAAAELIVEGRNGVTAQAGDEAAFIAAAVHLAEQPASMAALGARARQTVLPRSWAGVVERFESVLKDVVGA